MTMRLPQWIKTGAPAADLHGTKYLLRRHGLATVCEEARCPNRGECFSRPTAAFMILGRSCTRGCGFCSVHTGPPGPPQSDEPGEVAAAAAEMGLRYVVITSVTRDDLPDNGAGQFAATVRAVRKELPRAKIEVLTPDFQGDPEALMTVLRSGPDVFNHNMETVERLYPSVRPNADYRRSLVVLGKAKAAAPGIVVKSGFMLGLGESPQEVEKLLGDLISAGADMVTIGQYLRPTRKNLPVVEYVRPEVFEALRLRALEMGFKYAASGPLVRSSMNAEEMFDHV
ncbi:MAG: lipoyl synthase [Thermodesulfovibrionales bacterium]